jgi:hypothetical protein
MFCMYRVYMYPGSVLSFFLTCSFEFLILTCSIATSLHIYGLLDSGMSDPMLTQSYMFIPPHQIFHLVKVMCLFRSVHLICSVSCVLSRNTTYPRLGVARPNYLSSRPTTIRKKKFIVFSYGCVIYFHLLSRFSPSAPFLPTYNFLPLSSSVPLFCLFDFVFFLLL